MKSIITCIALGLVLPLAPSHAALVAINRVSEISGMGANGFDIPHSFANTTELYATFDQIFVQSITVGWVESYTVGQRSTVGADGFSITTSFSGSATSGVAYGVSTYTHLDLAFYVDTPSYLTLSGTFSRTPTGSVDLRKWTRGGASLGLPVETLYTFGDPLSQTFLLDPAYGYRFQFHDEESISSFSPEPPYAASHQMIAAVSPVSEPTPSPVSEPTSVLLLLVGGLSLLGVRRNRE